MYYQQDNPWANAFGLLGMILGKNAADRQGVKDNMAAVDAEYGPAPIAGGNVPAQGGTLATPSGGLLGRGLPMDSGKLASQAMGGYTPNAPTSAGLGQGLSLYKPEQPEPKADNLGQGLYNPGVAVNPATAPVNAAVNPVSQAAKDPLWSDRRAELNKGFAERLRAAAKTMSPDAFQKAMPQFRAQFEQDVNDARAQFDKDQQGRYVDQFEAEQDPRKKIAIGLKTGLIGKEGAMMLVQPGTETKVINTGGENVVVGFNRFTGKYVDLKDGAEIDPAKLQEMLKPTLTPGQVLQGDLTREGHAISAANAAARAYNSNGGFSAADARRATALRGILSQHEAWVQHRKDVTGQVPDETQSPYYNAAMQAQKQLGGMLFGEAGIDPNAVDQNAVMDKAYNDIGEAIRAGKSRAEIEAKVKNHPALRAAGIDPNLVISGIEWPQHRQAVSPADNPGIWIK